MTTKLQRALSAIVLAALVAAGCTDASSDQDGAASTDERAARLDAITEVLPADARSVFAVDLGTLLAGDDADEVRAMLDGEGVDPAWGQWFEAIGGLAEELDLDAVTTAAVVHATDAAVGPLLLAEVGASSVEDLASGELDPAEGAGEVYVDEAGKNLALLDGGVLAVGTEAAVASVVDGEAEASPIEPFLPALDAALPVTFASALPALFDEGIEPDRTLRGAAAVTGALDIADGAMSGELAFHTSNAEQFLSLIHI